MIDTILIRVSEFEYLDSFERICSFLEDETDFVIKSIDHTDLRLTDFDVGDFLPVSLDRRLALKMGTPYLPIRRVFDLTGNVIHRQNGITQTSMASLEYSSWFCDWSKNEKIIIDTDMASGNTIELAKKLLGTTRHSVPIILQPNEDLIDVEDLFEASAPFVDGELRSYLCNQEFFARRTSLPGSLYEWFVNEAAIVNRIVVRREQISSL